jgi:branched-chain amino acid transport system substrate-binding protein
MPGDHPKRRAVLGGAAMLAATPLFGARAQVNPVRIGVLTDESGPYGDSGGAGSVAAARMAAQDFGGVVLGRKIQIDHADTQNKPDIAGTIARGWYDAGVDAIIDLPVTPVAAAVQQIAREKNKTVMITAAAVSEFTSRSCSPVSSHWADDTHAMATGVGKVLTGTDQQTWFFITVDFSFGAALQAAATQVIEAYGGRVLGTAKFPIGNADFSSQIVQAQSSGAKIIGLASVGGDQVNLIKQCAEFGLQSSGARLAAFLVYITDIHALGLPVAQGLSFPAAFYWDQNDDARAFAKRFQAERKAAPTQNQALVYTGTLHFLKAMAQAGTDDAVAVNKAMRALPVAFFGRPCTMRADGRVLFDVTLYRVKRPSESRGPWDYYTQVGSIPPAEAFLPINPACVT